MMNFKEFTQQVRQDVQTTLDAGFPGTRLEFNQVDKLQRESYTAPTVTPSEKNIGMNINLDRLYDRVQKGESYDSMLQTAKDMANEMMNHTPQFKIPELTSYETAKDLLFVDVVGVQANAEMLQKVPTPGWRTLPWSIACRSTPSLTAMLRCLSPMAFWTVWAYLWSNCMRMRWPTPRGSTRHP